MQANLPGDNLLQRDGDFRRDIADERDGAALADAIDRGVNGFVSSDGFENHIDAVPVGELQNLVDEIGFGRQGGGCAEFFGHLQARVVEVGDEDPGAAGGAQGLQDEDADHSGTDDECGAIGGDLGDGDGVERDGNRLEHGCFGEGKLVWKSMNDAGGNGDILGKRAGATVVAAGNAEDLAMVAEVYMAAKAVFAGATVDSGVEGDAVTFGESGNVLAYGGDASGGFVAHYDGRNAPAGGAVVAVNIAAADATGGYLDQDFIG